MSRLIGLPLVLVSLAVGGYLFYVQTRSEGPTAPAVTRAEAQAESVAAGSNFQGADVLLQAWYAENATYAGATLPPGSGVVLVRADASTYCLQTVAGELSSTSSARADSLSPDPADRRRSSGFPSACDDRALVDERRGKMTGSGAIHYRWDDMPKEALKPDLERRLISTERMMLAHVYRERAASCRSTRTRTSS